MLKRLVRTGVSHKRLVMGISPQKPLIFGSLALITGMCLASCSQSSTTTLPAEQSDPMRRVAPNITIENSFKKVIVHDSHEGLNQTRKLPNGTKVTPIACEHSDTAQVLGVKMWKFNVQFEKGTQVIECTLETRRKENSPVPLAHVTVGPSDNLQTEILIGLHPSRDSWSDSEQIKTLFQGSKRTASTVKDNPFKGYLTLRESDCMVQDDGSIVLMVGSPNLFSNTPVESGYDTKLVLVMRLGEQIP